MERKHPKPARMTRLSEIRYRYWGPEIQPRALDKLGMLDTAVGLQDLKVPPGNRLEPLRGEQAGEWSIRINDQWRICFRWEQGHAFYVEIVDYH